MQRKTGRIMLEIRLGSAGEEHKLERIRRRKRNESSWESEGLIVPIEGEGQHNPA